jgi:ketosteroid isomerase-like protein
VGDLGSGEVNVQSVKAAVLALEGGDVEGALKIWHPDLIYWGFDTTGDPKEFRGRDAFFGLLAEAVAGVDEFSNELIDVSAIGSDIVVCHCRGLRWAKGASDTATFDFAQLLRFDEGLIT